MTQPVAGRPSGRSLAASDRVPQCAGHLRRDAGAGAKIGLTTVYRALQALGDAGEIDVLRTDDGEAVYRACATVSHHHHLVCRRCGKTVEVAGPDVERWAEAVGKEHGFTDVTHTVEVFGTCPSCAEEAKAG